VLGGRQAVTLLTKATWWCGGIFLVLSLVLSLVPRGGSGSALQERLRATTPAGPAPSAPLPLGGTPTEPATPPAAGSQAAPAPGAAPGAPAPAQPKK
jgi:preprotein translocase subunit SecG